MGKMIESDYCYFCGCMATEYHEIFYGRNRKLSIKYGLQVPICRHDHREVHDNPRGEKDIILRTVGRNYFEETYPELDFVEVFK